MSASTVAIHPIATLKDNYVWALIDPSTRHALIVDPGEAAPIQAYLSTHDLLLKGVLITHHHWDHTNGLLDLIKHHSVPVAGPALEAVPGVSLQAQEGTRVSFSSFPLTFDVLDIPGHTCGHIAYVAPAMVFCGDTLFSAGCGRLFEGTALQLYTSLQTLGALPDETYVYCGHEYTLANLRFAATVEPENIAITERIERVTAVRERGLPSLPSTIATEKATNPFLRCQHQSVIQRVEAYANRLLPTPVDVFTWLRKWKDNF